MTDLSVPPPGCFPIRPLYSGRDNTALTPFGTATQKMADLALIPPPNGDDDDDDDLEDSMTDPATPLSVICRIMDSGRYSALSCYLHSLILADLQVLQESDFMEMGCLCKEHIYLMRSFYHKCRMWVTPISDRARIIRAMNKK